ncbi:MAG: hypothetical protein V1790_18150 [Planctomycetota bacterium]
MARHQLGLLVVVGVGAGAVLVGPRGEARGETILYVDANAGGPTHNGSSWCSAYLELQPVLSVAAPGTTIRVADGVYRSDPSGLPRARNDRLRTQPLSICIPGRLASPAPVRQYGVRNEVIEIADGTA